MTAFTNYLDAGAAIRERLRAHFADDVLIKGASELSDLTSFESRAIGDLALFVGYDGDRVQEPIGRGEAQAPAQRWAVIVAVRSRIDPLGGMGIEAQAGPVILQVLQRLQGWRPMPHHTPLVRVQGPNARYGGVFAYFSYVFETTVPVIGAAQLP